MIHLRHPSELAHWVGRRLGHSDWIDIDQRQVTAFGHLTHDSTAIHLETAAAREAGLPGTIVHGFFTLALIGGLFEQIIAIAGARTLNYGVNKVRFPRSLPTGERVRLEMALSAYVANDYRAMATFDCTMAGEAGGRPACVASLVLYYRLR